MKKKILTISLAILFFGGIIGYVSADEEELMCNCGCGDTMKECVCHDPTAPKKA